MSEDAASAAPDSPPALPPPPAPASTRAAPRAPSRRLGFALALAVALALVWIGAHWWFDRGAGERDREDSQMQRLQARVEALARSAEQARRDADGVRARLEDADKVNASLREQLLGLNERARLVEDAVTNLADKRVSGHDRLLLDEAEILLALGGERLRLFHDPAATLDAYHAADAALSAVDDAAFSTVRQSISAESDALGALKAADPAPTLARLAALRADATQLPAVPAAGNALPADAPRWQRLLAEFVRVRHDGDAAAQRHAPALARSLFTLALRDAEAALLARDEARWHGALGEARRLLDADFDAASAPVAAARATLDALAALALAPPPPPVFGSALKELRNLRSTHALQAAPAKPAAASP